MISPVRRLAFILSVGCLLPGAEASAQERLKLDEATVEVCFVPGADCAGLVATVIAAARERVWLQGYGFSERVILNALRDAHRRRVDVRILLDRSNEEEGRNSGAAWIARNGIPVWIDRSVRIAHNKLVLIDRDTVVMGSLNWTRAGNTMNAENVHVLRGAKRLAERHEAYFLSRQKVSNQYDPSSGPKTRMRPPS
jgi:phosphatidylserine/phosphatidylglycerophosphate/cardiolipin synthase-like enzyme